MTGACRGSRRSRPVERRRSQVWGRSAAPERAARTPQGPLCRGRDLRPRTVAQPGSEPVGVPCARRVDRDSEAHQRWSCRGGLGRQPATPKAYRLFLPHFGGASLSPRPRAPETPPGGQAGRVQAQGAPSSQPHESWFVGPHTFRLQWLPRRPAQVGREAAGSGRPARLVPRPSAGPREATLRAPSFQARRRRASLRGGRPGERTAASPRPSGQLCPEPSGNGATPRPAGPRVPTAQPGTGFRQRGRPPRVPCAC